MSFNYQEVAAPSVFPVTLAEAKTWLRVDGTADDTDIQTLIEAGTIWAEQAVNRPLIERQFTLTLDQFPACLELDKLPLKSVDSIVYLDTAGASQTLSAGVYRVSLGSKYQSCRITPSVGQTWPQTYAATDAVIVTFTAGYGVAAADIPQPIKLAIRFLVAGAFDARCSFEQFTLHENPTAQALLRAEMLPRSLG